MLSNQFWIELQQVRRYIHARPELSGQEKATAEYVCQQVRTLAPTKLWEKVGGTGVIATFDSGEKGPHFLFRAELDALPIQESNNFSHRSLHAGISHKCGHDGHTTVLLGLARLLHQRQDWKGKVSLLFQPAEETGAGALAMLKDPRIQEMQVDAAYAFHNLPGYPLGQIVIKSGAFTPAVQSILLKLQGHTAHAAEPENGLNPALALAEVLQLAKSLELPKPDDHAFRLLTPVFMELGEKAYGVSAGEGEVHFTLRAWTKESMDTLVQELLSGVEMICGSHHLRWEHSWTDSFRANFNQADLVAKIRASAEESHFAIHEMEQPLKWGEDFGAFTEIFPAAMFGIGAGEESPALHHEDYDFPDELIEVGVRMFWGIIKGYSKPYTNV
ncbi:MAG: amidohydrolase [Saprospiraceae bacterium]|nr:amidohydrolase [Saprospiraceae bacterium]